MRLIYIQQNIYIGLYETQCLVSISNAVADNIYHYMLDYYDGYCLERYCDPGKPMYKCNLKDLAGIAYERFVRNDDSVIQLPG